MPFTLPLGPKARLTMRHKQSPDGNPLRRLFKDRAGSVAAWSAVAFPVMAVGAAVSVDVARLQAMDTDLQVAVDALARAGAAELDQSADSLVRARRAVNELLSNDARISADKSIAVSEIRFLSELPTPSYSADTNAVRTETAAQARYVEVRVAPKTVRTLFPKSLSGAFTDVSLSARSVAGVEGGDVCGAAPVFICNPFENDATTTIQAAANDPDFQRRQITFILGGQGKDKTYSPGNFGWLDPYGDNSGASRLRDAIGMDVSDVCLSKSSGVYLRPGKIASMAQAVNTRFDIYEGAYASAKSDVRFAPAENVVKGWAINEDRNACVRNSRLNACEQQPNSHALGLPRDSGSDPDLGSRIGNGDWDFTRYMLVNHPGFTRITIDGVTYRYKRKKRTFMPETPPSRYAMYRWEIDNNCVPGALTYGNWAITPEEGLPQCHQHGPSTTVEDRRIINVAVLNCQAIQASGEKMTGRTGPLPVETFVRVFLTEPMGQGQDNEMRGEVVGLVTSDPNSATRDRVALVQ